MTETYECKKCGGKREVDTGTEAAPECCEQPMAKVPLPFCTTSDTAEHSRMDQIDEPCDDGRAGSS